MVVIATYRPEIWKAVNDQMMVSTRGRVKSTMFRGKKKTFYNKISPMRVGKRTYSAVRVLGKVTKIHKLVMQTFFPHNNPKWDNVDHIDGNGQNNCIENLRWCTHTFNQVNGLSKPMWRYGKWQAQYMRAEVRYGKFDTKLEATIWLMVKKYARTQKLRKLGHAYEPDIAQFYLENLGRFFKPTSEFANFFCKDKQDGKKDGSKIVQVRAKNDRRGQEQDRIRDPLQPALLCLQAAA